MIARALLSLALAHAAACRPPETESMSDTGPLSFERTVVVAHRGASAYAPEHTHAAWEMALDMGADYIEQDLQMTLDGVLVVLHDETLDRTARGAGCTGRVIDRTLAEIRECDVGLWFDERVARDAGTSFAGERIPTLDEVLGRYRGRARFYIETKNPEEAPGMEEALVGLLREHGLATGSTRDGLPVVIIQSFSAASLRTMQRLAPDLPRVQLLPNENRDGIVARFDAIAEYAHGIGPSRHSVDSTFVRAAADRGLVVHPYTVNDEADMQRLLELGVDGMFTDRPDVLLRMR